jgi:hypothetical protein
MHVSSVDVFYSLICILCFTLHLTYGYEGHCPWLPKSTMFTLRNGVYSGLTCGHIQCICMLTINDIWKICGKHHLMVSLKICVNIQPKSKISPTKWCVNIHIQYTHKNTYTHVPVVPYTHLTHMIYHVVMEIGLWIKQSKHNNNTTGWATPNSLPGIIVRSFKVGPSRECLDKCRFVV